jgi:hypothetical protein
VGRRQAVRRRVVIQVAFFLACLLGTASLTFAQQEADAISVAKWRPKDGLYIGKTTNCSDTADLYLELGKNSLNAGGEESCKVVKLLDTAPAAITMHVTCTDTETEKPYKKIILLKKIDDKTIFWQATARGRSSFAYPGVQVSYCSEKDQRAYLDSKNAK